MTEPLHDPRVDELRQQLRALGYSRGSDRFVSAPRWGRAPRPLALLASSGRHDRGGAPRPAAAIAGRAAARLVTGRARRRDLRCHGGTFGVAVSLAAFVGASSSPPWGSRVRARPALLSRAAGDGVAIACLLSTLWWRSPMPGSAVGAGWTAFALRSRVAQPALDIRPGIQLRVIAHEAAPRKRRGDRRPRSAAS